MKTMGAYLSYHNTDCFYLNYCHHCKNCFGCIGLRHKQHCILNTQYSKKEYEELVPKIISHMQKTGEWSEFFPARISPYSYNESTAQDFFPLTKEQAQKQGFSWQDIEKPKLDVERTIPAERLPDSIEDIPDDILNWAVECVETKNPFRILRQELQFYRTNNLPLPRLHPDVRYIDRMEKRGHGKLWKRECMKCRKEMQTTYSPERPEKVYCEECYLKEVY